MAELETADIDPITFEVLANAFNAIVDDMGAMLEKVSFSTVTTIGKDYACVLATPTGEVFARGAGGLPLLTGTATARIEATLAAIGLENMRDGDVFLHNDPFTGGTHGQDVAAIMPIFVDGEAIAFAFSSSHWPDVGGAVPGSFNSDADSTHGESLLIPPTAIISAGTWNVQVEQLILRNVRIPDIIRGDLRGMIEACRIGRVELLDLVEKYGLGLVLREMTALMSHSERLMRQFIGRLPNGIYSWTDYIDRDPGSDSDEPIEVVVDVTVEDDQLIVDFTRSGRQAVGPVNASRSATVAAFSSGLKEIFHEVPWNAGLERPVQFITLPGSIVDAEYPHPVSGVAASPAEKVIACVHGCFMQIAPERSMACPTNLVNVSVHGRDTRDGRDEEFVMYIWLAGGWGGRVATRDAGTSMFPLGPGTNLQPAESLERIYPIQFDAFELETDSEGAGLHRGGFGFSCPFRVVGSAAKINVQGDRQRYPGWGYDGGLPAKGNGLVYAAGTGSEKEIAIMSAGNRVDPDVRLDFWQSGGAGWGQPLERPVDWVTEDVLNGLVSVDRARDVYGVVYESIDLALQTSRVNASATSERRAHLRSTADDSAALGTGVSG
jgi:N-methylhydantoinase B